jgi:hypothetical protein
VGCGGASEEYQSFALLILGVCEPRCTPPPRPEILFKRAEPPALIFASRRSLRMRAWSAALEGGVLASDEVAGGVSAILLT